MQNQKQLLINLPAEIVEIILSFVTGRDLFCLVISQLFTNVILSSAKLQKTLNTYFIHILCKTYTEKFSLYEIHSIFPAIINNNFYFSIDLNNIRFIHQIIKSSTICIRLFWDSLLFFSLLWKPYTCYLQSKNQFVKFINWLDVCHSKCNICSHYQYTRIAHNSYRRLCCNATKNVSFTPFS
jgi:hypothetical protein